MVTWSNIAGAPARLVACANGDCRMANGSRETNKVASMTLPIHDMAERHRGLTVAVAESYTEAARVCLDRHHESPVGFKITNSDRVTDAVAEWKKTDERTRGAWANEIDATEAGACACALAAVELSDGLVAVHRAETKTGADYYIAPPGRTLEDLEDCLRLEVSGVDRGGPSVINQRLRQKREQTVSGASNLPAMASVVGFRARVIQLSRVDES